MRKHQPKRVPSLAQTGSLCALDLFKGLPADSLRDIAAGSEVHEFDAGHVFFRPGESGQSLFFLEKGRIQTFRTSGAKKLVLTELAPPAVFGEMACIGQGVYHCFAEAIRPSRVRTVSCREVELLLQKSPALMRRLLDLVGQRFVQVLRDLESTSFRQLIPRMAALLLERAEEDVVRGLTHRELAEFLGVYRESATAALGELRKAGIVSLGRKQIRILDRARLERAARE
jgi:CRP-like cAMP-binding protein